MPEQQEVISPLIVFYSYAPEDEVLRDELEKHLSLLQRERIITSWHPRQILPGTDKAEVIDTYLSAASIILLLISPDFLASDYYYSIEMQRALERHTNDEAIVIPVLLRPVDWQEMSLERLQSLPSTGKPVTLWENRDEAFRDIARGVRQAAEYLSAPPDVQAHPFRIIAPPPHHPSVPGASHERNRQRMLERVRALWITGVLEQSLHNEVLISLGLKKLPDAVANPWRLVVQNIDHPAHPLPQNTRIVQVYDEAQEELLILGEPGAGKTTLLLELARDLLNRAEQGDIDLIPVVFNLSSWTVRRRPLAQWLVEELNTKYQVPRKLARRWIDAEQVLPLLDGLDEVAEQDRAKCIDIINEYRREHGLVPMVVCCRTSDYREQKTLLLLHSAVEVQPLTQAQVETYLVSAKKQLAPLRDALRANETLRALVSTPLMLSVLTLAYQGTSLDDLLTIRSLEDQQDHVFATYIQRMLRRRGAEVHYTQQQIGQRLTWLAGQLIQHNQVVFYIERMQPDWLPTARLHFIYQSIAVRLVGGLFGGLVGWLIGGLLLGLLGLGPLYALAFGLIGVLVGALTGERKAEIEPAEAVVRSWASMWRNLLKDKHLRNGLVIGLVLGPIGGLLHGLYEGMTGGLVSMLVEMLVDGLIGMLVGVLVGMLTGERKAEIEPAEVVVWSWASMWRNLRKGKHLRNGLFGGLVGGVIGDPVAVKLFGKLMTTPIYGVIGRLVGVLVGGLIGWLLGALISALVGGLLGGLSSGRLGEHNIVMPNQGTWRSARNSVLVGLVCALAGALISALIYGFVYGLIGWLTGEQLRGLERGLVGGLLGGLPGWLIGWLRGGGDACVQHVVLRLLLWRTGFVPWNYPHFLDYVTRCILLRKVGGGYIFVHHLLLKYFASHVTNT